MRLKLGLRLRLGLGLRLRLDLRYDISERRRTIPSDSGPRRFGLYWRVDRHNNIGIEPVWNCDANRAVYPREVRKESGAVGREAKYSAP